MDVKKLMRPCAWGGIPFKVLKPGNAVSDSSTFVRAQHFHQPYPHETFANPEFFLRSLKGIHTDQRCIIEKVRILLTPSLTPA